MYIQIALDINKNISIFWEKYYILKWKKKKILTMKVLYEEINGFNINMDSGSKMQ